MVQISLLTLGTRFARLGRFPMGRAHPQGAVTRLCVKLQTSNFKVESCLFFYCAFGATTWNDYWLMANEERLSASPRTCRLTATGDAQTLILSSLAIRIILQSTSCFAARSGGSALRLGPSPLGDKSGAEAKADRPSRKAKVAHSRLRVAQANLAAASPRRLRTTVAHSRMRAIRLRTPARASASRTAFGWGI